MKKFTKKTEKSTGRYRSFYDPIHHIKYNKKEVGYIEHKTWKIKLRVTKNDEITDDNPNCQWEMITLKYKPSSLEDAMRFLNENRLKIFKIYELYLGE